MNQSFKSYLLILLALSASLETFAQIDRNSELFRTLKSKDSILFEIGFNKCEIQESTALMAEDLEFYHDKSGITNSREAFRKVMEEGLCDPNNKSRTYRYLLNESLEVYPLYNDGELYGALQNGIHYFSSQKNLSYAESNNDAKFSHLWLKNELGEWKIKRVISFDHRSKKIASVESDFNPDKNMLKAYCGSYKASTTGLVEVSTLDGNLEMSAGTMQSIILPQSKHLFKHPEAPLSFEFVIGSDGRVHKLVVRENGNIVEEAIKL